MSCENYYGKVFAHVGGALGLATLSAEYVNVMKSLTDLHSPFLLFGVNVVILLGLLYGIHHTSPGPLHYVLFVLFAGWIGQTVQPLVQKPETKQNIVRILALTTGVFLSMMVLGFIDNQHTLGFYPYLIVALVGLLIAHVVLSLYYSKTAKPWLSTIGVAVFALLTVYDTQVIKKNKQACMTMLKRGIQPDYPTESIGLFLNFVHLFSHFAEQNS
jgi:hypothetical protein